MKKTNNSGEPKSFKNLLRPLSDARRKNKVEILGHSFGRSTKYGHKVQHITPDGLDRALLQSFEHHENLPQDHYISLE